MSSIFLGFEFVQTGAKSVRNHALRFDHRSAQERVDRRRFVVEELRHRRKMNFSSAEKSKDADLNRTFEDQLEVLLQRLKESQTIGKLPLANVAFSHRLSNRTAIEARRQSEETNRSSSSNVNEKFIEFVVEQHDDPRRIDPTTHDERRIE